MSTYVLKAAKPCPVTSTTFGARRFLAADVACRAYRCVRKGERSPPSLTRRVSEDSRCRAYRCVSKGEGYSSSLTCRANAMASSSLARRASDEQTSTPSLARRANEPVSKSTPSLTRWVSEEFFPPGFHAHGVAWARNFSRQMTSSCPLKAVGMAPESPQSN